MRPLFASPWLPAMVGSARSTPSAVTRVRCAAAGNFGTVFVDQAYWQSAIAAKPSSSHKGYLLGGMLWFCIPFTLATCLGLASR